MQKEPHKNLILGISILIPVIVIILFNVKIQGYDLTFLPPVYASINAVTSLLLITAFWAIKSGKRKIHERIMKTCIGLSAAFLAMYVAYHMTSESTSYGGEGWLRYFYFSVLITHISLSIGVTPLILFTFSRALAGNFERHRALAKFAFPIWLYVAISGVVVYLMISPYYSS